MREEKEMEFLLLSCYTPYNMVRYGYYGGCIMKKIVLIAFIVILTCAGCNSATEPEQSMQVSASVEDTQVNETDNKVVSGKTVVLYYPYTEIIDGDMNDKLNDLRNDNDFISVEIFNDDYFQVEILESRRKEIVKDFEKNKDNLKEMFGNEEIFAKFDSIKVNNKFTVLDFYLEKSTYDNSELEAQIVGALYCSMYQMYDMVDLDKRDLEINFYDTESGEKLNQ